MRRPTAAPTEPAPAAALDALIEARERTLALVAPVSDSDLEAVHSPLMSPLVWDLGHIAAYEDLWLVHRHGERALLREDLADVYDAFETPRACRGELPYLRSLPARSYLDEVRARTLEVISERGIGNGTLHEMVVRHEHPHDETMLQAIQLGRLPGTALGLPRAAPARPQRSLTGFELILVPPGPCTMGAGPEGFAYDNERPRHRTDVRGYLIGRTPITNASYLTFVEGGGYQRREWWSDEGWAWKEEYDIARPAGWTADGRTEWRLGSFEPLHPHRPVGPLLLVRGRRLRPRARRPAPHRNRVGEGGDLGSETRSSPHLSVGRASAATRRACQPRSRRRWAGSGRCLPGGSLALRLPRHDRRRLGVDLEPLRNYPGFTPFPYKEYSQVFFGDQYLVLRGGSWATRPRGASPTFRNWDYPQRRQIFAGFRIAKDRP